MNRHITWSATLFVIGITATNIASADIFAFSDENGTVSLSNQPTDSRYTVFLQTPDENQSPIAITANTALPATKTVSFGTLVDEAARSNDIEAALLHAVITAESNYNTRAVSRKGAIGLMQLMPATAKRYGVTDIYDPAQNVAGGTRYLKYLLKMFNNDQRLTLAAYNAGENAVARFGNKIPSYRETRDYVNKVMSLYNQYRANSTKLNM